MEKFNEKSALNTKIFEFNKNKNANKKVLTPNPNNFFIVLDDRCTYTKALSLSLQFSKI